MTYGVKVTFSQEVCVFCSDMEALIKSLNDPKTDFIRSDKAWTDYFYAIDDVCELSSILAASIKDEPTEYSPEHKAQYKEVEGFGSFYLSVPQAGDKLWVNHFDLGYGDGKAVWIVVSITSLDEDFAEEL